jgi:hypothetical protein
MLGVPVPDATQWEQIEQLGKLRQHILYLYANLSRPSLVPGLAEAHLPPRE